MEEKIIFTAEDGTETAFYVLEQTKLGGVNYLLVADSQDDDAECLILKDLSEDSSDQAVYEPVEDEVELDAVARVFAELLEDVTIE